MCGEMCSDSESLPLLLGLGLDEYSMTASVILKARALMRKLNKAECQALAAEALACETASEVHELVSKFLEDKGAL